MKFKILKKFSIVILLSLFAASKVYCSNLKFYHLNTSNGLSQNTIYFVYQDSEDYFWIGTNGGLNKWNGYNFESFVHSDNNSTSIGQGRVTCISEELDGTLWIGTLQGGVSQYNKEKNNFKNYNTFAGIQKRGQGTNITQVVHYKGLLIIGTFGNGLFYLDKETSTFMPINIKSTDGYNLSYFLTNQLIIDQDSSLWIGHNRGAIKIIEHDISSKEPVFKGQLYLEDKNVLSIFTDSRRRVWFGTHNSGAFYLENNEIIDLAKNKSVKPYYYSIIRAFNEDKDGNIWMGTGGNGLNILDTNLNLIKHYQSELHNAYSLSSNIVYQLFRDKNDNMWVGTYNGGLNFTNNHKQSFNHVRGFGIKGELTNNAILSMCSLDDDNILIGTDGGGISVYNRDSDLFTPLAIFNNHDHTNKNVPVAMAKDKNGIIYIGTYLKGLYQYNPHTKELKNYRAGSDKYALKKNDIWSIAIDKNNKVWLGTLGEGVAKFDPETEKFYNYRPSDLFNDPEMSLFVFTIFIDENNHIWIGTQNHGIVVIDNTGKGIYRNYLKGDNSGLTSNEVWKIYQDKNKDIWIATHDGGLGKFNKHNEKFEFFSEEDGLLSNTVRSLIEDHSGNLWIGTEAGLSYLNIENGSESIKNFTQQNGLQGNEFNTNAAIVLDDGTLFFGGNNGFNHFKPSNIIASNNIGPLIISDILALYNNDHSGESSSVIANIDNETNTIDFNHNVSLITIEYALLDYTIPELNNYSYQLKGFDKNWIEVGNSRHAKYTNLDPGEYTFKVRGTNSLGIHTPNDTSVNIEIHPPYWQKTWFKIVLLAFLTAVIIIIYRLRLKSFRDHEKLLKEKVENRTTELVDLNKVLAIRNTEIKLQSEELKTKSEHLGEVNSNLEKSSKHIELQNIELEKHRNNLEMLVVERTKELEEAKRKAEESEQLKMAFLANMSHEIRTPMNAIVGFSTLISQEGYTDEERADFTQLINSNSNSLLLLIDDILDLSRLEANQLIVIEEDCDLVHILNEIVANWRVIEGNINDKVTFNYTNNIKNKQLILKSDSSRIKQILNNLIDNAFKFTSRGSVNITSWVENNYIVTEISDTGIGITEDNKDVIFDRFRKNEDSKDKKYRGAGLGLTISKKLAHMLKGDLWADSEFGSGSKFFLKLPLT